MPKDRLVFKFRVLPLVLLSCCAWLNQAQASGYLPPRLVMDANAGGSATVGQADLLLSLKGDERRTLYLDPQAAYGTDEQWFADLGLGYRWIQNEAAILGAYVFAGHSQVANQSGFWIANPGVEAMGSRWDARVNGYIPVGGRSNNLGVFQFIQSSQFVFKGHTKNLLTTYVSGNETQQIGDGVDARVGYQVFRNVPLKAYLGAYFFDIQHTDNVRGGAAGLEYWFDRNVKVFANYTYDNLQRSTLVGGLALSFGGVNESRADPLLSERLTDPVERYLANLGHGSGIPSETIFSMLPGSMGTGSSSGSGSSSELISSSIAYFSQNGSPNNGGVGLTLANCTFANPCGPTDFSQTGVDTLSSLLPNTLMLFNAGTYSAVNGSSALTLNNGQGVFGRAADSTPASGPARPTFNGAFILTGNNTLDSIILNNSLGATTTAIMSSGGQNLIINNTDIGSARNPYNIGFFLDNSPITLNNSTIYFISLGMVARDNSTVLMQSSTFFNRPASTSSAVMGIVLVDSNANINNSAFNVLGLPGVTTYARGVVTESSSVVAINNSNITVTNMGPPVGDIVGLELMSPLDSVQMNGGSLTVLGNNTSRLTSVNSLASMLFNTVSCTLNGTTVVCA